MDFKSTILYVCAVAYMTVVCCVYLVGFWMSFDIDIFQYIGIFDVFGGAAFSFIATILILILSALFAIFTSPRKNGSSADGLDGGFVLSRRNRFVCGLVLSILSTFVAFKFPKMFWFAPIVLFVSVSIWTKIQHATIFCDLLPDEFARKTITFVLCMLPCYLYWRGVSNADRLLTNKSFQYVYVHDLDGKNKPAGRYLLKLLGVANKHYFFQALDNSVLYVYQPKDGLDMPLYRY